MKLQELNISPESFIDLQYGTTRAWLLITAVEFKLFNLTVEEKTAQEIAEALKTHEANTELFLNSLCSIELLSKKNGAYRNTELAETFLVEGRHTYLGEYIYMSEQWNFQSREQMKQLIQNGPLPPQETVDYSGDYFADYVNTMKNFARSGVSQLTSRLISGLPEFKGMRKMLELGGAHGMDCIATVMQHPTLEGVVFDKPAVVLHTKEVISEYGMEDRVSVLGGDYAEDSIGSGYDLVYAKATLNFMKDNLVPLFEKIHDALNPGGVFISVHDGLTDEKTKPADMVISWLPTGMSSIDFSLERELIPEVMLKSGFKSVQLLPYSFAFGDMDMVVGRK